MNTPTMLTRIGLVLTVATLLSCSGSSPTGPNSGTPPPSTSAVPGDVNLNVSSSGADGYAFRVTITGPEMTNIRAGSEASWFRSSASGNALHVIAIGHIKHSTILTVHVPDTGDLAAYSVELDGVAGKNNQLLSTSNFSLSLAKQ